MRSLSNLIGRNLIGMSLSKLSELVQTFIPYLCASCLFTVRKAQGYTTEEALDSVEETVELNTMIDELNRDKPTFFQEEGMRR